jgi:hypothetical protein
MIDSARAEVGRPLPVLERADLNVAERAMLLHGCRHPLDHQPVPVHQDADSPINAGLLRATLFSAPVPYDVIDCCSWLALDAG